MNGNEPSKHPDLFDHEGRITKLEEAVKYLQHTVEDGFARMDRGFAEQRAEMKALRESMERNDKAMRESMERNDKAMRESMERNIEALRQEFHHDRRFAALVFLTTQLAVIGALLKLAGII